MIFLSLRSTFYLATDSWIYSHIVRLFFLSFNLCNVLFFIYLKLSLKNRVDSIQLLLSAFRNTLVVLPTLTLVCELGCEKNEK